MSRTCDVMCAVDHVVRNPRPSPSTFTYCRHLETGGGKGLVRGLPGMELWHEQSGGVATLTRSILPGMELWHEQSSGGVATLTCSILPGMELWHEQSSGGVATLTRSTAWYGTVTWTVFGGGNHSNNNYWTLDMYLYNVRRGKVSSF